VQSCVLEIMNDVRARASSQRAVTNNSGQWNMTSFKKNLTLCDMRNHADLRTLGRFVRNRHTFTKLALSDVSCRFSKSIPIP
jgi:hypothetical protein